MMRIINEDTGDAIDSVAIMLTPSEASELASKIRSLDPEVGDHIHVTDLELLRQITVLVYTPDNLKYYSEEVRKIIGDGDE
jgi:hypothetical protein